VFLSDAVSCGLGCRRFKIDQGQAAIRIVPFPQMRRAIPPHNLKGRAHVGLQQMTGNSPAIPAAQHAMDMKRGFAIRTGRETADQGRNFNLLRYRDGIVAPSQNNRAGPRGKRQWR
jgi:hypothetical protein